MDAGSVALSVPVWEESGVGTAPLLPRPLTVNSLLPPLSKTPALFAASLSKLTVMVTLSPFFRFLFGSTESVIVDSSFRILLSAPSPSLDPAMMAFSMPL